MKWETVKATVAGHLHSSIIEGRSWETDSAILIDLLASNFELKRGKDNYSLRKAYADKAFEVVSNWDIRSASKLRDLFPGFFPPSLKKKLIVEYGESGEWEIFSP
jgi:hypothetical protein